MAPKRPGVDLDTLAPRITRDWFILCASDELGDAPLQRRLWGQPVALFRDAEGAARALVDRCPHRNVPLSMGDVVEGTLRCAYHGWRFAGDGRCVAVPALEGEADRPVRRATALPTREQQGFVWVWADTEHAPDRDPFRFECADAPGYVTVRRPLSTPGSLYAVIENALDVPHTAFLHGGLFRKDGGTRQPVRCVIRREGRTASCAFLGERRPPGIAARLLSPSGGEVEHTDRFHLPSITEVEYRLGTENHLVLQGACTPVDDWETVVWAVVSARTRLPGALLRAVVEPLAVRIFGQDRVILDAQLRTLRTFEEARFASTDVDVLGHHILRLMQRAARGEPAESEAYTREVTMWL